MLPGNEISPCGRNDKEHRLGWNEAESQHPGNCTHHLPLATRHCCTAFSALRAWHFLLLAQKKGTVEAGTRVSGGCAVPSPLAVRRATRKLALRAQTVRAADPPPWLRGSAAPDGELPPPRTDTDMGAVGARHAVPLRNQSPPGLLRRFAPRNDSFHFVIPCAAKRRHGIHTPHGFCDSA